MSSVFPRAALFLIGLTVPAVLAARLQAQSAPKPAPAPSRQAPVVSPEIAADGRVTFRLRAPGAREVKVGGQWTKEKPAMAKDADGLWSVTVGPVPPGVYEYNFSVDGLSVVDPANPQIKPQRAPTVSILDVPAQPPLVFQMRDVPHGTVHVHHYRSRVTGGPRRLHVYTPPGYERAGGTRYPTLYLLHGRGDNDGAWSVHGRANFVLDNLIAEKKARPMLIVMTDGHVAPEVRGARDLVASFADNTAAFQRDLLEEVMPLVESSYRVRKEAASRAIVGLSMGGGQALTVGLGHPDRFGYVGSFSGAAPPPEALNALLAEPAGLNRKLRWLWIGCGKDDFLLARNEALIATLKEKGVKHVWRLTEGGHSWPVWRDYLAEIAPALFLGGKS